MSVFGKLFGDSNSKDNPTSNIDWNNLTELKQLDEIVTESASVPVIIFKHSTRCGISRMALKNFEGHYSIDAENAKPYFLDLLAHRDISNEIASRFDVVHQSPQLILIKNGKAVYTVSHSDIDAVELKEKVTV
ncbi:bacillithiol system redox-active protein YtxJ [Flavobacterium suzhouense]|uniref:Bacillithiol system redox-active protein YtxJ n=1 Tax=Flavobacterium suzhouense TaxID=1529638 RepID=A0ABW5NVD2_9FLAO